MRKLVVLLLVIVSCLYSCREQYDPKAESLQRSFLVVEANLNPGPDSTIIRLTRTTTLDDVAAIRVENNALVTVEGEDNTTRTLIPRGNGYYVSANLNLTINTGYRLHITTTNGKQYLSDYVKARLTPPIDSINSEERDNEVWIYANTHDASGNSRYYRWSFDETWEILSYYYSEYIWGGSNVRPRVMPAEEVFRCWKYDTSKTILLANSTRLQNDVIYRAPLTTIPFNSEKLSVRYSVNVSQYALDKEAYDFFELMKKNTEEVGNIFAPQPFELTGNIRCTNDPSEYTLGYITASTVQKSRKFVTIARPGFAQDCPTQKVTMDSVLYYFGSGDYIPYTYDFQESVYLGAKPPCTDCRRRGGNLTRPSYW